MKYRFVILLFLAMFLSEALVAHNPGSTFPILWRVDNLPANSLNIKAPSVTSVTDSLYYSKSNLKLYNLIVEVDFKRQVRIVYLTSSKADSGYLFINSRITDLITELHLDCPKVTYLINGDIVETEDEVLSLLALEKGRICELLISYFNNSNCIEVNIGYYKGRIKHKRA